VCCIILIIHTDYFPAEAPLCVFVPVCVWSNHYSVLQTTKFSPSPQIISSAAYSPHSFSYHLIFFTSQPSNLTFSLLLSKGRAGTSWAAFKTVSFLFPFVIIKTEWLSIHPLLLFFLHGLLLSAVSQSSNGLQSNCGCVKSVANVCGTDRNVHPQIKRLIEKCRILENLQLSVPHSYRFCTYMVKIWDMLWQLLAIRRIWFCYPPSPFLLVERNERLKLMSRKYSRKLAYP